MANRKRRTGFDDTAIKQKAFHGQNFGRLTKGGVAAPAHLYNVRKPAIDGNTKLFVEALEALTDSAPAITKSLQQKGNKAYLRGDTRPEGLFSQPIQEGWDYTESQAKEGGLYAKFDKGIKEISAQWDGKNPDEFVKNIGKMSKAYINEHTKGMSDAALAGAQNSILKVTRDTDIITQSIVQKKVAANGLANIKNMAEQRMIEIYQIPDAELSRSDKAKSAKDVLTEMQALGAEKYGLDKNDVTNAFAQTIAPSGAKNPALFELFYVEQDGIKSKNTAGGKGVEAKYLAALEAEKENAPTAAYDVLQQMPQFKNVDKTFNYTDAMKYLDNPINRESLGLETIAQVNEVKAYMYNSYNGEQKEKAAVKQEYMTTTLNTAFDMIYKNPVQNTNDAIKYIKASDIDGLVKHRVIKGLLTNTKKGNSAIFNRRMDDILEGRITHPSAIYELMGNHSGVTFEEGKKLLSYFGMVNQPELQAFKMSNTEIERVLTKGGIKISSFSTVRQDAAKMARIDFAEKVAALQKAGKPVDWSKLTAEVIKTHKPTFEEELQILQEAASGLKAGKESIDNAKGAFVTVKVDGGSFKVSPGITDFETFVSDVMQRRSGATYDEEGVNAMMSDDNRRNFFMEMFKAYQTQ